MSQIIIRVPGPSSPAIQLDILGHVSIRTPMFLLKCEMDFHGLAKDLNVAARKQPIRSFNLRTYELRRENSLLKFGGGLLTAEQACATVF